MTCQTVEAANVWGSFRPSSVVAITRGRNSSTEGASEGTTAARRKIVASVQLAAAGGDHDLSVLQGRQSASLGWAACPDVLSFAIPESPLFHEPHYAIATRKHVRAINASLGQNSEQRWRFAPR